MTAHVARKSPATSPPGSSPTGRGVPVVPTEPDALSSFEGNGATAQRPLASVRPRQLVRHHGAPDDPPVRVWRVTRFGVWVTLGDGRRVCWHPDDVEPA